MDSASPRVRFPHSFVFAVGSKLKGLRRKQSLAEHMSEIPATGHDVGGHDRKGAAVSDDAVSAWFLCEILPLEAILMTYLRHNWRNASDISDLRQEIYARVFEAARERIPDNPKRFLLTSARNLLIDLVRREQVVPMETFADLDALGIASGAPDTDRVIIEQEELQRVEAALAQLPPRTREAIELAYFEGLSRTEIARRMGITHQVASRFVAKGALILGRILYGLPADGRTKS
jgi:RNA polymerase sigma factor (sigma-70 family)